MTPSQTRAVSLKRPRENLVQVRIQKLEIQMPATHRQPQDLQLLKCEWRELALSSALPSILSPSIWIMLPTYRVLPCWVHWPTLVFSGRTYRHAQERALLFSLGIFQTSQVDKQDQPSPSQSRNLNTDPPLFSPHCWRLLKAAGHQESVALQIPGQTWHHFPWGGEVAWSVVSSSQYVLLNVNLCEVGNHTPGV